MSEHDRGISKTIDSINVWVGLPLTSIACGIVVVSSIVWGLLSNFNSVWGLVIGAGTGLLSMQLLFLLQHSGNRGASALHLKLDRVILALESAPNAVVGSEDLPEEAIQELKDQAKVDVANERN